MIAINLIKTLNKFLRESGCSTREAIFIVHPKNTKGIENFAKINGIDIKEDKYAPESDIYLMRKSDIINKNKVLHND